MAFDACMMRAVLHELWQEFPNARIEKVVMPQNDEVDLLIHAGRSSGRLVFNVGPNSPRMQLSEVARENPKVPPNFCMFLRKHLTGARIVAVGQIGFDRVACLTLSATNEMGFPLTLKLMCEIMGKYANLILLDEKDTILSALKMIDFSASSVRQILPGLRYMPPEDRKKLSPLTVDEGLFFERLAAFAPERTVEGFITSTYAGIATQIAHELCYRACGALDVPLCHADTARLYRVFSDWQRTLIDHAYTPTVVYGEGGKPREYAYMPLTYFGNNAPTRSFLSNGELMDVYFAEKDRMERLHCRAHDLLQLLGNAEARTKKKLALQRASLLDSERAEEYKRAGDLITANLYQLKRGMTSFVAIDYYEDGCPERTVTLDGRLSPAQNAQRMYKQYTKCKTAKEVLTKCIAQWEQELLYLDSVRDFLMRASTEQELTDIREELYGAGYASKMRGYRPERASKQKPLQTQTSGGYTVLIGRNNLQNDTITFKMADKGDLWFHAKDLPGSHVILRCAGEEPPEADYTEAAALAAGHSKATGELVAVDYTRVKHIKKPAGAKPGFVIYHTNYTAYVKPMRAAEKK